MKNIAVILAGGSGTRFGGNLPKQLTKLAGKTILEYTIDVFVKNTLIDSIIIVVNQNYYAFVEDIVLKNNYKKDIKIIFGGDSRKKSSYSAIKSLEGVLKEDDNILFHDAVRPFLDDNIIENVINALEKYNAIDVAIPVVDTIIEVENNIIKNIPKRSNYMRGQTPQGFKYGLIKEAHEIANKKKDSVFTDDCGLVLKYFPNEKIHVVKGDEKNIKITYPMDLIIANNIIQLGVDVFNINNVDVNKLKGTVNIIFGHTSGIGKALYEIFKLNKIKVYGFSKSTGTDISNSIDIQDSLEGVYNNEGKIDNVIVTAGVLMKKDLISFSEEEIIKQININYIGSLLISKLSAKYLEKTKGNIILLGSSSYSRGRAFYSIYSSIKAALVNFTQAFSEEVLLKGIKVNIVNPERTLTNMRLQNFGKEDENTLLLPYEVAKVILRLLLSKITGQIINVKVSDFRK